MSFGMGYGAAGPMLLVFSLLMLLPPWCLGLSGILGKNMIVGGISSLAWSWDIVEKNRSFLTISMGCLFCCALSLFPC